jgi:molybdopterin molybdotransferase
VQPAFRLISASGEGTVRDVRMKGFAERSDVEDVERFLVENTRALEPEPIDVSACAGRVLARDVAAEVDVPGFARAAMDGYAVRGEDTFGASAYDPIALRLLGQALPGAPFAGRVGAGSAVRVMTGAPLPDGADAVAMAEVCEERDGAVAISEPVAPRKHVGAIGEDVRTGQLVLRARRVLRPQDAGLLASIGVARPLCVRQPRVRLVITGDELLPPGSRPSGARIVDSNSVMLAALVARDGGVLLPHAILPDRAAAIRSALASGGADVALVSGGSSVGQEDHAPRLVEELGSSTTTASRCGRRARPASAGSARAGCSCCRATR